MSVSRRSILIVVMVLVGVSLLGNKKQLASSRALEISSFRGATPTEQQAVRDIRKNEPETAISINKIVTYKYILGITTGHTGSTTAHRTLNLPGCPMETLGKFEWTAPGERLDWNHTSYNETCKLVNDNLIPEMSKFIAGTNKTFVDLGHFHNRGPVVECLSELLQDQVLFVRIRRNRHSIARSFAKKFATPCLYTDEKHPALSNCPHSLEIKHSGPVYLKVNDEIWNSFSPFQKFLWYADEVEERWHILQTKAGPHRNNHFREITWSSPEELSSELHSLRQSLGCVDTWNEAMNTKKHVKHKSQTLNCTNMIQQDLEYRRLMKYSADPERYYRLFQAFPQNVNSPECMETREELKATIQQYVSARETELDMYVLPS